MGSKTGKNGSATISLVTHTETSSFFFIFQLQPMVIIVIRRLSNSKLYGSNNSLNRLLELELNCSNVRELYRFQTIYAVQLLELG